MPSLNTELSAEVRDRAGSLIYKAPFTRCHSLVKQFAQILTTQMSRIAMYVKNTAGSMYYLSGTDAPFHLSAATATTYGIVIGDGDTNPVAMDDYKLENRILTNIVHGAPLFATENPNLSTWRTMVTRGFTNNTGAIVNVKEVGLYVHPGTSYYCIDRTLYEVSFATGETLTLTYRFTITL